MPGFRKRKTSSLRKDVNKIKRMLNTEKKYVTFIEGGAFVPQTVTIDSLSNIDEGTGPGQREGQQVRWHNLIVQVILSSNNSAENPAAIRLMLVHDKQTNGAFFGSGDVLNDPAAVSNMVSQYNNTQSKRFNILRDKTVSVSTDPKYKKFTWRVKLNQVQKFDGTGAGIADIASSSLALMYFSTNATNQPTITYSSRLFYVDN